MNKKIVTEYFLGTNDNLTSWSLLLLRAIIGIVLFMVGSGKVLGWFGGFGLQTTIQFYTKMGIPTFLAYLSCYTEFVGGFLLIIGLFTRPVAFAVMINMLVATIVMFPKGFIFGGADFPFTLLIIAIIIMLSGPMNYSLDFAMSKRSGRNDNKMISPEN